MKTTKATLALVAALSVGISSFLVGCGGGNSGSTTTTRELLAGTGTATSPTVRYWRTISLKANTTYYNATGGDQACPVTITGKDGSPSTGCSESQFDAYRSDGKIAYDVTAGAPNWSTTTDTFTINGSEITITDSSASDPTDTRTILVELISSTTNDGAQRLRLRIKKETLVNGTDKPNNVGLEIVLEEAAA